MDLDNPVVRLCGEGMQAEGEGRKADALALFMQAWSTSADGYEAAIAAHYVARHQPTDADTLHWNRVAVAQAEAVPDERVTVLLPSLYLNLGHSHEVTGDPSAARRFYERAADSVKALPEDDPYSNFVRGGIARALGRVEKMRFDVVN